jgi:hypothetical protein
VTEEKRFIVAQRPPGCRGWCHYLHAWVRNGEIVKEWTHGYDPGYLPIWCVERDKAMKLDEQTARLLVDRIDLRYGQTAGRRVVEHLVEELS